LLLLQEGHWLISAGNADQAGCRFPAESPPGISSQHNDSNQLHNSLPDLQCGAPIKPRTTTQHMKSANSWHVKTIEGHEECKDNAAKCSIHMSKWP
jgi:hypothetical protein